MKSTMPSGRATTAENGNVEDQLAELRRTVRDLAALSAMSSIWVDFDLARSLQNLVDVLRAALRAVTVCIRVELPDGTRFEGEAARGLAYSGECTQDVHRLLDRVFDADRAVQVAKFNGDGPLNALPHAIYSEGRRIGTFVACYRPAAVPGEHDRLLFHVAANQITLLFQRHREQEERLARKLAEERLRQAEHHYQQLVQSLPAAVYTCDNEGRITLYNEAAVRLWGRQPKLGEDRWCGSWKIFKPDGSPMPLDECPMAIAIRERRSVRGQEIIVERPDGSRAHVLPHPDPIRDQSGAVIGAVNMLMDIGELKRAEHALRKSEAQMRSLLTLMPAAVYACDVEGRITYYNKRAAELWGREPKLGDMQERFCAAYRCWFNGEVIRPEDTPMALAVREGKEFRDLEPEFERPDGVKVPVLVNIGPLYDSDGKLCGAINVFQDVTDLRRAEQELEAREQHLRTVIENTPECVKIVASDGTLLEMNHAGLCAVEADSPEQVIGKNVYDIIAPENRDAFRAMNERVCRGETARTEFQIIGLKGTRRWMETHAAPIMHHRTGRMAHLAVTRDITAIKETELELRRKTEQLSAFFDTAAVGLHRVGPDGRILWANAAEMQLLGYSADEYIGRHISEFHADPDVIDDILTRLNCGEKLHDREARLKTKDGSIKVVLIDSSVFWENGEFVHTQCFMRDITERKHAEERLRKRGEGLQLLSDTLGQLLSARDPETIVRELFPKVAANLGVDTYFNFMVNDKGDALELHSCAGIPEETAKSIQQLQFGQAICGTVAQTRQSIHATDIQNSTLQIANLVRGFGIHCYACNPLMVGDRLLGTLSIASRTRKAFDDDELQFLRIISQYTAVALERLRGAERLEMMVAERTASLRNAIAQMEEFSYTVSHDLRAPLRGMQVYTEALLQDFGSLLPAEAIHYLNRIGTNAIRLDKMILDVLTFSRLARAELRLEQINVDKLVRQIVEQYPGMQGPNVRITIEPLHDVIGHEPSITQAMSNLLHNAVKFVAPNVNPIIRVFSERRHGWVRLWVIDNGIGVNPKYQQRLFKMFERVHPDLKYDGTGVGLAIVRKAVDRMGGKVGVESDGANGSRFWIELPAGGPK